MIRSSLAAAGLLAPGLLAAQPPALRAVAGGILTSRADPAAVLTISRSLKYAGGQTIDILKVAGAEQHFFIETSPDQSVVRFCWIQFEHYYPANHDSYDYTGITQTPIRLGRLDFQADATVVPGYFTADNRPGSDSQAALDYLRSKGFRVEGTFARLRMFHLPDSTRRKELMIIYGERVKDGTPEDRIPAGLRERAQRAIAIR